jgi:thiol-disulfide isomerase/thioredoxin
VFFATWCENCKKELPHLRSVMQKLEKSDVVFLGVANPEDTRNPITVDAYVPQHRLEFFDVALDRGNGSSPAYGVSAFPAAVVIDRKGTIRWRGHPAFFPRPLVDKLLEEKG